MTRVRKAISECCTADPLAAPDWERQREGRPMMSAAEIARAFNVPLDLVVKIARESPSGQFGNDGLALVEQAIAAGVETR